MALAHFWSLRSRGHRLKLSSVDNASYTYNARKFATWVASCTTRCKREKPEMSLEAQMVAERLTAPN